MLSARSGLSVLLTRSQLRGPGKAVLRSKIRKSLKYATRFSTLRLSNFVALAFGLAASLGTVYYADTATARTPAPGAIYLGFDGRLSSWVADPRGHSRPLTGVLRISRTGRRLSGHAHGSWVAFDIPCRNDRLGDVGGRIPLAVRNRGGPRIARDGSFGLVKRTGLVRYRLSGRFVADNAARVVYSVSRPPRRPRNSIHPGRCATSHQRVALRKDGEPPFSGCKSQRAATLISSPLGRVFAQYRSEVRYGGNYFDESVFACLFKSKKRFLLSGPEDRVRHPRLAGPYVAFGLNSCSDAGCVYHARVRDLRDGTTIRDVGSPGGEVMDLELKDNGSIGWIAYGPMGSPLFPYPTVWADDSAGLRRLDGGNISQDSLGLNGSTLTWVKDGTPRSATLN